jgi:prepilin-type N-terminal cleavage/methylation domain-containing protein
MIRKKSYGFTLVELIVVITIFSTLLPLTIPVFKKTVLSPGHKEAEDLSRLVSTLKHRAILENQDFYLHLDTGAGRIWITDSAMDEPEQESARNVALTLKGNLRISGIEFPGSSTDTGGSGPDPVICFNRHGYSDQVILHVEGGKTPFSLIIQPFLMEPETVFNHVSFDDCT